MARTFNGTSDKLTVPSVDLSAYSLTTVSVWYYNIATSSRFVYIHSDSLASSFYLRPSNSGDLLEVGMGDAGGGNFFYDTLARPADNVWHHALVVHDRTTPRNLLWLDGVKQALTTFAAGSPSAKCVNATLSLAAYSGGQFMSGRIAEFAIWGGISLGDGEARMLANYASPEDISSDKLVLYLPIEGIVPEKIYNRERIKLPHVVTLTGTTSIAHPLGPITAHLKKILPPLTSFKLLGTKGQFDSTLLAKAWF